jgi:uncharacterized protein
MNANPDGNTGVAKTGLARLCVRTALGFVSSLVTLKRPIRQASRHPEIMRSSSTTCLLVFAVLATIAYATPLTDAARQQVGVTTSYDPAYRKLAYPGGDVPPSTGVCCDVIIRAFRVAHQLDLQLAVHEDMRAAFSAYPQKWGVKKPDANIDHRRVLNLMTWFRRQGWAVGASEVAADFSAGDVVAWDLGGGITHIGIVSDRRTKTGTPLVLHNIGRGAQEEDVLFAWTITGHYRAAIVPR